MEPIVVGVDLGGTNVRAGAVSLDGRLVAAEMLPIEATRGPQYGLGRITAVIEHVMAKSGSHQLLGIGVGSTGPIDRERGRVQNPYTLPTWENVSILDPLREHFKVPAVLENDADVAALGEAWLGAGKGVEQLVAVTVGTGIGTAFIYRGQMSGICCLTQTGLNAIVEVAVAGKCWQRGLPSVGWRVRQLQTNPA